MWRSARYQLGSMLLLLHVLFLALLLPPLHFASLDTSAQPLTEPSILPLSGEEPKSPIPTHSDPVPHPPAATVPPTSRKKHDFLYLNFPGDGPESAMLADMLSQVAVRALFGPWIRPASILEIVDTLNYSVYTTMLIVGSFVFGLGLVVLSRVSPPLPPHLKPP